MADLLMVVIVVAFFFFDVGIRFPVRFPDGEVK